MLGNGDPVRYGLLTNLVRPEGNVTGVSFLVNEVRIKLIELVINMKTAKTLGLTIPSR